MVPPERAPGKQTSFTHPDPVSSGGALSAGHGGGYTNVCFKNISQGCPRGHPTRPLGRRGGPGGVVCVPAAGGLLRGHRPPPPAVAFPAPQSVQPRVEAQLGGTLGDSAPGGTSSRRCANLGVRLGGAVSPHLSFSLLQVAAHSLFIIHSFTHSSTSSGHLGWPPGKRAGGALGRAWPSASGGRGRGDCSAASSEPPGGVPKMG